MADLTASYLLVLIISAFALPLVFVWWIRNTKRVPRPPIGLVLKAFAWGAVFSVIIALVVELLLTNSLENVETLTVFLAKHFSDVPTVIAVLIAAPVVEEAAKAVGVFAGRPAVRTRADGIVFGAAAGLGFSATENLFYGLLGIQQAGLDVVGTLILIAIRSFSSSLLHASSTSVTGFGLAGGWLTHRRWAFLPYYLVAVAMHATFNFLASFGDLYSSQYGDLGVYAGFGAAVLFAVTAVTVVRYKLAQRPVAVPR